MLVSHCPNGKAARLAAFAFSHMAQGQMGTRHHHYMSVMHVAVTCV